MQPNISLVAMLYTVLLWQQSSSSSVMQTLSFMFAAMTVSHHLDQVPNDHGI